MSVPNPATTEWVPLWDLEGGVNLEYKGSWVAGSYVDGDVVVHQGTTYMCVRPTSAAPVPWPLASGSASYGTSPPANPVDGQIWIYPADPSAGVMWQFRYRAGATLAHKWEFIGGSPSVQHEEAAVAIGAGVTSPTGPVCSLPRAGVYVADFRGYFYAGVIPAYISFWIAGPYPGLTTTFTPAYDDRLAATNTAEMCAMQTPVQIASATTICAAQKANENTITSVNRSLVVTPVCVS